MFKYFIVFILYEKKHKKKNREFLWVTRGSAYLPPYKESSRFPVSISAFLLVVFKIADFE